MPAWLTLIGEIFLAAVKNIPLIAVWIANRMGKSQGIKEQQAADDAANAQAQGEYAKIATQGTDDAELDQTLDRGEF